MNLEEISMMIIANSGMAKSSAFEAIDKSIANEIDSAKELIEEAEKFHKDASSEHLKALSYEAEGNELKINILFLHAEDQMMAAENNIQLAKKFILLAESRK